MIHAMLFYQYLHNNGAKVALEAIDKPDVKLEGLMDALKAGLEHEEYVTSLIHTLYAAAHDVNDFRTTQFLDWSSKSREKKKKSPRIDYQNGIVRNRPKKLIYAGRRVESPGICAAIFGTVNKSETKKLSPAVYITAR